MVKPIYVPIINICYGSGSVLHGIYFVWKKSPTKQKPEVKEKEAQCAFLPLFYFEMVLVSWPDQQWLWGVSCLSFLSSCSYKPVPPSPTEGHWALSTQASLYYWGVSFPSLQGEVCLEALCPCWACGLSGSPGGGACNCSGGCLVSTHPSAYPPRPHQMPEVTRQAPAGVTVIRTVSQRHHCWSSPGVGWGTIGRWDLEETVNAEQTDSSLLSNI